MDASAVGKRAGELFRGTAFCCSESLLIAVSELVGVESPLIPKIATGFCGGLAHTGGVCGAVNGGVMALGLVFGRDSADVKADDAYKKVREFLSAFEKEYGCTNCTELTGFDLSTPEGHERFKNSDAVNKCHGYVESAARIVAGLIISGRE